MARIALGPVALLGVIYLLCMGGVVGLLVKARTSVLAEMSGPEAQRQWKEWKRAVDKEQSGKTRVVQRRRPKSEEPPSLILLRDHFPALVAASLVIGTCLFAFLAFVLRGMFRPAARAP